VEGGKAVAAAIKPIYTTATAEQAEREVSASCLDF
jgi:hypothetical protein